MVDYLERNELSKDGAAPDKNEGCQDQESPFGHKKKKVKSQKGKGQKSKVSRHTSPVGAATASAAEGGRQNRRDSAYRITFDL
jgi:hypothetical protein